MELCRYLFPLVIKKTVRRSKEEAERHPGVLTRAVRDKRRKASFYGGFTPTSRPLCMYTRKDKAKSVSSFKESSKESLASEIVYDDGCTTPVEKKKEDTGENDTREKSGTR